MEKNKSLSSFFASLWRGICRLSRRIGNIIGIDKGRGYVRNVWRLTLAIFVTLLLMIVVTAVYGFYEEVLYPEVLRPIVRKTVYWDKYVSDKIVYQYSYNNKGRIYDKVQKSVILDDVDWVYTSNDCDSLAVYARNGKRGYFDRFTGKVVIPEKYTRAWVFSEGLAAVEEDFQLKFIDHTGSVVIDKGFSVMPDNKYAFTGGCCIVQECVYRKFGLIDRKGNWVLQPEYDEIQRHEGMWRVQKNNLYGLFSESLDTLYQTIYCSISVSDSVIEVREQNHIARRYNHEGNLLVDFVIDDIVNMQYVTTELYKPLDGLEGINNEIYGVADCQKYLVYSNGSRYYGLLNRKGMRVTNPDYTSIEAIAKDLYLCQPDGVVINGGGKRVDSIKDE